LTIGAPPLTTSAMTLDELRATLMHSEPPPRLPLLVHALWLVGRGDWNGAHAIAQEIETSDGSWVHAHLHRKEGDEGNAAYWYQRAGRPVCTSDLAEEWEHIARSLLGA
jgi:hypothetical protein